MRSSHLPEKVQNEPDLTMGPWAFQSSCPKLVSV